MQNTLGRNRGTKESGTMVKRGQKKCPECSTIMGSRAKACKKCGHIFPVTEKPSVKIVCPNCHHTFSYSLYWIKHERDQPHIKKPKRGQRQCPSCLAIMASKVKFCKCGYVFPKSQRGTVSGVTAGPREPKTPLGKKLQRISRALDEF